MLTDEYTREYDIQEAYRREMAKYDKISRTAARFGLEASFYDRGEELTTILEFPNGKLFKRFLKLKTALTWANYYDRQAAQTKNYRVNA